MPEMVLKFALRLAVKLGVTKSLRVAVFIVHLEICYNTSVSTKPNLMYGKHSPCKRIFKKNLVIIPRVTYRHP